jgi:hypothetical protein
VVGAGVVIVTTPKDGGYDVYVAGGGRYFRDSYDVYIVGDSRYFCDGYDCCVASGGRYFRDGYAFFRIHSRENRRKCFVFVSCSWHIANFGK